MLSVMKIASWSETRNFKTFYSDSKSFFYALSSLVLLGCDGGKVIEEENEIKELPEMVSR